MDTVIVEFIDRRKGIDVDLEIPLDITANELVEILNDAYKLGIDTNNMKEFYIKAEEPIVLLKGASPLSEFGIRTGSILRR